MVRQQAGYDKATRCVLWEVLLQRYLVYSLSISNWKTNMWQFWVDRGGTFTDVVARDPLSTIRMRLYRAFGTYWV